MKDDREVFKTIMKDEETVTQINLPEQRIMQTKLKIHFLFIE